MYKHHEESIEKMIEYFSKEDGVIALILGGSVAKGREREDSDLDGIIIVTPKYYEEKKRRHQLAECIHGFCTYPKGYFDCKYYKKEFLQAAAKMGSEPARNAFWGARVLFTKDPEIEKLINEIPLFQQGEYEDKMLSFYSALMLNYNYFWNMLTEEDSYMRIKTASEIIYHVYRMILQENKIIFPCNRNLELTVEMAQNKPEGILEAGRKFSNNLEDESCKAFVELFLDWLPYNPPEDKSVTQERYVADYELWWKEPRPLVNEW